MIRLRDDPKTQARFHELYKAKLSNVAIARKLCVSLEIVKQLCRQFGLRGQGQRRVSTGGRLFEQPYYQVRFARLYAKGLVDWQIGEALGISANCVATHRRSLGLDGNGGTGRGGRRTPGRKE